MRSLILLLVFCNSALGQWLQPTNNSSVNVLRIQKALEKDGVALLSAGDWTISRPIVLDGNKEEVRGVGRATKIKPNDEFEAFFLGEGNDWCGIHDLMTVGGKHGIKTHDSNRLRFTNLWVYRTSSHGIYFERTMWICSITNVDITWCGGDGLRSISGKAEEGLSHRATGNALSLVNCNIEHNAGCGINWCATTLNIQGCCIEGNSGPGLQISAYDTSAISINVAGNHFEANSLMKGEIHFETKDNHRIQFVEIAGNLFSTRRLDDEGNGGIIVSCNTAKDSVINRLCWRQSNRYGSRGVPLFRFGRSVSLSRLEHVPDLLTDMPYDCWYLNTVESSRRQPVMVHTFKVFCNADRVDQQVELMQVNSNAIVLDINKSVMEEMDGEDPSFECQQVGTAINAIWSNKGGSKGIYRVRVIYAPGAGYEEDIEVSSND